MTNYYSLSAYIELGILKTKLEGLSEKRVLNLFRKSLQEFVDNISTVKGYQVVKVCTYHRPNTCIILADTKDYSFINDFDYCASNRVEENAEYKVVRYFSLDFLVATDKEIDGYKLLDDNKTGVVKIGKKQKAQIVICSVKKELDRNLGYTF